MFSRLREHFGTAGLVVAIVALVAALAGGAIAANGGSDGKATASAKGKQGPRGKTGKTGPQGPAGPAGPQGPAGPKGDTGAPGSNGTNGTNGATGPTGATGAKGAVGTPGEPGEPWTPDNVLPSGATETGAWRFIGNSDEYQYVPISFPIPLSPADADSITLNGILKEGPPTANCPGNVEDPKAAPGFLCVYLSSFENNFSSAPDQAFKLTVGSGEESGVSSSGTLLFFAEADATDRSSGTFAITAP